MHPIILKGRPAFSDFRLAALKKALNEAIDAHEIAEIDAVECYFIEAANSLDDTTNERAIFLLGAQEHFNHADEGGVYVTPRKGTISPWSTKATDIFHNCALEAVARVERGIHYRLSTPDGLILGIKDLGWGLFALHDRMTEAVYDDISDFFSHLEPAPLSIVPLLAEGPDALA
ncbi:MAG: phosphoribosylformylglycinamidine synthase, partial [Verrucomicrobiota bacterium]|nr:phosphoribosylformylglycinamidine synthase [Verrucomicrobiota bacterium]